MRASTMEFNKMKAKATRDKAWQKRMAQPNQYNRYDRYLSSFYGNQELDKENQRKIAQQEAQNKGLLDVANRNQLGATTREKMSQTGQTGRTGMEQTGMTGRLGQQLGATRDSERNKALQERLKFYSTPEYDKTGTVLLKAPLDPATARKMAYGDVDMMYGNQGTGNRRQDNVRGFTDAQGIRNWTNQPETNNTLSQVGMNKEARSYEHNYGSALPGNYLQTPLPQRSLPKLIKPIQDNASYGPEYRGSVNPMARNNRPITPTPLRDIFGDFNPSVNPRYR